jgi:outer membrane protein TolC
MRLSALVAALALAGCGYTARPLSGPAVLAELRAARAPEPAPPASDAETGAPLGYEQAVAQALAWSPRLKAQERELAVAVASVDEAHAWPASQLRFNDFGWREGDDTLDDFEIAFRWRLPNPFERAPRLAAARAKVPAEQAERDEEAWEVRYDVRLTWAEAVAGRWRTGLAAELARSADALVEQAHRAIDSGVGDPLAVLPVEVAALKAAAEHEEAQADARRATGALLRRLGRPDDTELNIPEGPDALRCPPPPTDLAALEDQLARSHPAVRRLEADYAGAEALLEAAQARQLPFLEYVQLGYGYDPRAAESGFTVSLSIELPFDAWGGGETAVADAQREWVAAELRATVAARADATRAAVVRWREAAERVRWYEERIQPALDAATRQAEEAVRVGAATDFQRLAAHHKASEARLAALDAVYRCHLAWVDAEHAAGVALPAR